MKIKELLTTLKTSIEQWLSDMIDKPSRTETEFKETKSLFYFKGTVTTLLQKDEAKIDLENDVTPCFQKLANYKNNGSNALQAFIDSQLTLLNEHFEIDIVPEAAESKEHESGATTQVLSGSAGASSTYSFKS